MQAKVVMDILPKQQMMDPAKAGLKIWVAS